MRNCSVKVATAPADQLGALPKCLGPLEEHETICAHRRMEEIVAWLWCTIFTVWKMDECEKELEMLFRKAIF
jgi:hypothetical protein